jgi:hypothetical protein
MMWVIDYAGHLFGPVDGEDAARESAFLLSPAASIRPLIGLPPRANRPAPEPAPLGPGVSFFPAEIKRHLDRSG